MTELPSSSTPERSNAVTFATEYETLPKIDLVDPEFMFNFFYEAKEYCIDQGQPNNWQNVFSAARRLAATEFKNEFRGNDNQWQLLMSLSQPGLEVMRYFPKIAKRLGMDVNRELGPLWEYVDPNDLPLLFAFRNWNFISNMFSDLPQLSEQLKEHEEKPIIKMYNSRGKHGLTATIRGDSTQIGIRQNLDEHDLKNARKVAGILGPKIVYADEKWIIEEYIDLPRAWDYDVFQTRAPEVCGNIQGVALRKIHEMGFVYNSHLSRSTRIDPETNQIFVTNWCAARESGDKNADIKTFIADTRDRYLREEVQGNHLSSFGRESYIKAVKGFRDGYIKGEQYPLSSAIQ